MARKRVAKKKAEVNELEILHPERSLEIAGRSVTIREYGFVEGMKLLPTAEALIKDISALFAGDVPEFTDIQFIIAKHIDSITILIAIATGESEEWIKSLSLDEGNALMDAWWSVNGNFYIRNAAAIATAKKGR